MTYYFIDGKGISINSMNLIFLCAALLLYRTPRHMLDELSQASAGVWSIVFQFPFAGLIGIIKGTGLGMVVRSFCGHLQKPLGPSLALSFLPCAISLYRQPVDNGW